MVRLYLMSSSPSPMTTPVSVSQRGFHLLLSFIFPVSNCFCNLGNVSLKTSSLASTENIYPIMNNVWELCLLLTSLQCEMRFDNDAIALPNYVWHVPASPHFSFIPLKSHLSHGLQDISACFHCHINKSVENLKAFVTRLSQINWKAFKSSHWIRTRALVPRYV